MKTTAQTEYNLDKPVKGLREEDYISVSRAAELLSMSASTLRRLEEKGEITSVRHSNGYRMFKSEDVSKLKEQLKQAVHVKKIQYTTPVTETPIIKIETTSIEDITVDQPRIINPVSSLPRNIRKKLFALNLQKNLIQKTFSNVVVEAKSFIEDTKKINFNPRYLVLIVIAFAGISLASKIPNYLSEKGVKGIATNNIDTKKSNKDILGIRDRVTDFVYNINVPTNIRSNLYVDQSVTANEFILQGVGRITGLQDVDTTTKSTLERILGVNGDVTGTELTKVTLAETINYAGNWDFTNSFAIEGTTLTATADQLNNLAANESDLLTLVSYTTQLTNLSEIETELTSLAGSSTQLVNLAGSQVAGGGIAFGDGTKYVQDTTNFIWDNTNKRFGIGTNTPQYLVDVNGSLNATNILIGGTSVTTTANEINYLTGTKVTNGGIVFGDGTKLTQNIAGLYWNNVTNRLGIANTNPQYNLDITGTAKISSNVIIGGTSVTLTGTNTLFDQTTSNGNLEFKTATEGDIRFTSGSNGLIALTPSNESVYIEGNGLIVDEADHLLTVNAAVNLIQIGTNVYSSNLLNVNGTVGIGSNLFFDNTSGGVNLDTSYGFRSNAGIMQIKNSNGSWSDIASAGGLSPDGTLGAVQFTDGTNFVADSTNFNWNNTNKYLTLSAIRSIGITNPLFITDHNGVGGITIVNNGYVGISNTNPTVALDITGDIKTTGDLYIASVGLGSTALTSGATKIGIDFSSLANAPTATNVQEALAALDSVVGASAGDIQAVGSITSGQAFNSISTADGQWLGLGSNDGRIAFSTAPGNSQIHLLGANVGIGTTNAQELLDVNGTILADKFAFNNSNYLEYLNNEIGIGTSGLTRLSISATGKVGIGISNPDATLTIKSTDGNALTIKNFGTGAGQTGELKFTAIDGTYVGFKAPDSAPGNQIYVLPPLDGLASQVLTTDGTGKLSWQTASGVGSSATGDIEAVGSMTSGNAFSDSTANNQWLGLGPVAGRLFFSDDSTDEISFLNANIGIGKTNPTTALDVNGGILASGAISGNSITDGVATLTAGSITNLIDLTASNILTSNIINSTSIGTTSLTASGTVTLTGIASTNAGDNILTLDTNGKLSYRTLDARTWGTTLIDGSGVSNYLSRWFDANTLITGTIYDNGTNIGIGTTAATQKLTVSGNILASGNINGATITGTSLTDGSATLASGSITGLTNLTMSGTLTFGTGPNTIYNGYLSGNWNFSNGAISNLSSVSTTSLTASGTVTLTGIASTNSGDNVIAIDGTGKLNYRTLDARTWGSTLTDGSGVSSYISRWLDANTLTTSKLYDNGTNIGIGTTSLTAALTITPSGISGIQLNPSGTNPSEIRFIDSDSTNYTGFKSPNNISNNYMYTLPSSGGSNNYVLATDGTGNLSWQSVTGVGAGTIGGTGVASYMSKWLDASTLTIGAIYDNGSSIGIGTTALSAALTITPTTTSGIQLNPAGTSPAEMRFLDSTATNYTGFKAPSTLGANYIYTLPSSTGQNNYVLSTDASGNLSWNSVTGVGAGTIDGTGITNYVARWQDGDTLTTGKLVDNGTNVGVGNTNPQYAFDVTGDIYSSTNIRANTEMFIGGIGLGSTGTSNTTSGSNKIGTFDEFTYSNGTNVQTVLKDLDTQLGTTVSNALTGTGPTNYLSKYSALGGVLQASNIFDNGTNIGIGTTNPLAKLDVNGTIKSNSTITGSTLTDGTATLSNGSVTGLNNLTMSGTLTFGTGPNTIYNGFLTGNWNLSNGQLTNINSIGTTSLTASGTITGDTVNAITIGATNITSTGTITGNTINSTSVGTTSLTASGTVTLTGIASTNTGNNLINIDGNGNLAYRAINSSVWNTYLPSGSGVTNYLTKWTGNTSLAASNILYDNGTNIGIGTTDATQKLTVNGNILVIGTGILNNIGTTSLTATGTVTLSGIGITNVGNNLVTIDGTGKLDYRTINDSVWNTSLPLTSGTGITNYLTKWTGNTSVTASSILYDNGTNIGIGTTAPLYKLDIVGTLRANNTVNFTGLSAGTDNSVLGINTATGALSYRAIDTRVWSPSTLVGGSNGTANYIPMFVGNTSITNSSIYDNSGNVGVGTTGALAKFEVETGSVENKIALLLDQNNNTNNPKVLQIENAGTGDAIYIDSGEFIVDSTGNITTTGTTGITLNSAADLTFGSIGIRDTGTTETNSGAYLTGFYGSGNYYATAGTVQEALEQLDFQLNSSIGGVITGVGSISAGDVFANSSANGQWLGLGSNAGRIYFEDLTTDGISILDAFLGLGVSSPLNRLDINGGAVIGASYAGVNTAPANGLLIQGSLGLGTINPLNKLDISGSAVIGAGYAGTANAPTNGLLVQGVLGIGTTGITNGFEAYINGDLGIAQGGYLNIGTTYGSNGYGLRDFGGVLQAKDLGGNWVEIVGGGYWNLTGNSAPTATISLDRNYAYNLGIGTTSANYNFQVTGTAFFGSSTPSQGLYIAANGNVGIGTTNPLNNLDIIGNMAIGSYAGISTAPTNGLIISGNVGIGTSNPQKGLDVGSEALFRNNVFFAGGTTYYVDSTGNAVFKNLTANGIENPFTGTPSITAGNGTNGSVKIGTSTLNDAGTAYLGIDADSDQADEVRIYNNGDLWSKTGNFLSGATNSSTSTGFTLNTSNTLSDTGAKLFSVQNNGTEKMFLDANGNLFVSGTITAGNGVSTLLTNVSGTAVANRSIVIIDIVNDSSFTTTTTPYSTGAYGVVIGVGVGPSNDVNGNGICDINDKCMIAYGGEVEVLVKGVTSVSKGEYLFTSDVAGYATASAAQFDGLLGVITNTANIASGYVKMVFQSQPQVTAIATMDRSTKHNEYWLYADNYTHVGIGADTDANLLARGMSFDILSDTTKTDYANTNVSIDTYNTRAGLFGGQIYTQGTTDTYGNTLLGSTAVNDMFFYDRTVKDSEPQVQVELGIDPNWYNGVTLTTIDNSTNPTSSSNKNLSTRYNGSLLKVTGTYTTNPATIYITMKPLNTFDWTDNAGNSATGVSMTPGIAQALGTTGVYVNFTNTLYNMGDVFRIASWYVEPASATRGTKQHFPERSIITVSSMGTAFYTDVIDADTQKLWMRFTASTSNLLYVRGFGSTDTLTSVDALNGNIYVGGTTTLGAGSMVSIMVFSKDTGINYANTALTGGSGQVMYKGNIAQRNSSKSYNFGGSISLITGYVNDVSVAVIPNQPTQEVTVSGWGYITGTGSTVQPTELVNLPYKFNNTPNITASYVGSFSTGLVKSLEDCVYQASSGQVLSVHTMDPNEQNFTISILRDSNLNFAAGADYCYTWTATGTVSPKQFVAVATGSSSTDGGATIINETDGSSANILVGTLYAGTQFQSKIALTEDGSLYTADNESVGPLTALVLYKNVPTITTETSWAQYYSGSYKTNTSSTFGIAILGNATEADQIKSLTVTEKTSSIENNSNTLYVGTTKGISVIQENSGNGNSGQGGAVAKDGNEESKGSVKYYTKDYISEEMVGDIRGMWPLSSGTALSMTDVSVKANTVTNAGAVTATTGIRGKGALFSGTGTGYLYRATDTDFDLTDKLTMGGWIKTSSTGTGNFFSRYGSSSAACQAPGSAATNANYKIGTSGTKIVPSYRDNTDGTAQTLTSNKVVTDNTWHHVVSVIDKTNATINLYIDGVLDNSVTLTETGTYTFDDGLYIGATCDGAAAITNYFNGSLDELFITGTALTADQVKHMYETGSRALATHTTTLGGGSADANQQLGFTGVGTTSIGAAQPDWNNQYMYVGINNATTGGLSKIDLSSDTNVKTYTSSANVPSGGTTLLDEDINAFTVGYNLEAVSSASKGITIMGVDDLSTSLSGNFVSKTVTTPESFNQAYIWAQYQTDSSDVSNTIQLWASNNGGTNYYQCNLTNTDTNVTPSEYEYFCQFNQAGSDLKTKFVFTRGSTKTSTYVKRYGVAWLDTNNATVASGSSGFFTNTNTVTDGSYIQAAHNQNTNDVITTAWVNTGTKWEQIDASYKPAISSAAKDAQRNNYHEEASVYLRSTGTNAYTQNLVSQGLLFDTFEDTTKSDTIYTSVSKDMQSNDTGSNSQQGRVGLFGGQTYTQGTTDTYGNILLGATSIVDMEFYDRSITDSDPQVQVELGIDPNWFNGVTLTTIDNSTNPIANINTNLSTTYNGSLAKVTGTYTTNPSTIYIIIKSVGTNNTSQPTFDWTDNAGNSATGVSMTPGTDQALGTTGVSVNFTATTYHVGDVFKIASWYVEPASATRGTKQQFPERANMVAATNGINIVDADTQKLWMRINATSWKDTGGTATSVKMLNGILYKGDVQGVRKLDFINDIDNYYYGIYGFSRSNTTTTIAARHLAGTTLIPVNTTLALVNNAVNDIDVAVIPNQPTQEVTVSGWGFILGSTAVYIGEQVALPYKFNSSPIVNVTLGGVKQVANGTPTSYAECASWDGGAARATTVTQNDFDVYLIPNSVFSAARYYCYSWTATGTVSPKQFLAVATGTSVSDGGTTIINETDKTAVNLDVGTQYADVLYNTKVALTNDGDLYFDETDSTNPNQQLHVYYGIAGITSSETSLSQYRNGLYRSTSAVSAGWSSNGISFLGSTSISGLTSLKVTQGTSTSDGKSNTIYIGTNLGTTVIQEKQSNGNYSDGNNEKFGSVKYYTNNYISEEMIGDVRGMWPLSSGTALSLTDASIKANTLSNSGPAVAVSGVRGIGASFNGTSQYLYCTDASCGGTTKLDISGPSSYGAWIKTSSTAAASILVKGNTGQWQYELMVSAGGTATTYLYTSGGGVYQGALATSIRIADDKWHHLVSTFDNTTLSLYIDGRLVTASTAQSGTQYVDGTADFNIGRKPNNSEYFKGSIDEPFVTATTITADQVKHMYEVGNRALASHSTSLGGGSADANQRLGFTGVGTTSIGAAQPDWNNQYMYVGINNATTGGLSKIDLNSDTNVKTYTSSANIPAGGTTLLDEDVNALAVGYNLEAVSSAAKGITIPGYDGYSTYTSSNFISETYTLPKNISSVVLWASPVTDSSDTSNAIVVKASNDAGATYDTCTLVTTDSSPTVAEKEYSCEFPAAGNQLKIKFEFTRGSTKTNTYITQYGTSWLGETGFRLEQTDANTVRLYNYSGDTREMRLDVIANAAGSNSGYLSLSPLAADVDTQDNSNSIWVNKTGTAGNLLKLQTNGSDVLNLTSAGIMYIAGKIGIGTTNPTTALEVNGTILQVGTTNMAGYLTINGTLTSSSGLNPGILVRGNSAIHSYYGMDLGFSDISNRWRTRVFTPSSQDIAFSTYNAGTEPTSQSAFTDLMVIRSSGNVGIGTATPEATLDIYKATNTSASTTGTTLMGIKNYVGSDLVQQKSFIDFLFTDANTTEPSIPHVRIGAEVGQNGDANDIAKESSGAFVIYTATGLSSTGPKSLTEKFRVDNAGHVGIGTTNPTSLLDVNGAIKGTSLTDGTATLTSGAITGLTNLTMSGTLDLGTNTIYDGFLTGNWNFTNGQLSSINSIGTTNLTASGTVTLSGVGSTNGGDNLVNIDTAGKLGYRATDARIFGSSLTDGSGVSNYLTRWVDANTLTTGTIFDNGTNIGIGTTDATRTLYVKGYTTLDGNYTGRNILVVNNDNAGGDGIYITVGRTNPTTANEFLRFRGTTSQTVGSITGNGAAGVNYNTTSDGRLKTNIKDYTGALDIVKQIQPRSFSFKIAPDTTSVGFIAQELKLLYPYAVSGEETSDPTENPMGVDYGQLTPLLTQAIKELNTKVDGILDTDITSLYDQVLAIKTNIETFMSTLGLSKAADGTLLIDNGINVTGLASLKDVTVAGSFSVGTVKIDSLTNSIEILGPSCSTDETLCITQTLYIQKNLAGNIDFMNGKVQIMTNGDIKTEGTIEAKKILTEEYSVLGTSKAIGTDTLKTGDTEVLIMTDAVKETSKIFITAKMATKGEMLYVKESVNGESFTVAIENSIDTDLEFDWFIMGVD